MCGQSGLRSAGGGAIPPRVTSMKRHVPKGERKDRQERNEQGSSSKLRLLIYFISLPDVSARGVVGCHAGPPQPIVLACVGAVGGRERQARRPRVVAPPVGEGPEVLELGHRCLLQPEGITGGAGTIMSALMPRSGRKRTAVAAMEPASKQNSKPATTVAGSALA